MDTQEEQQEAAAGEAAAAAGRRQCGSTGSGAEGAPSIICRRAGIIPLPLCLPDAKRQSCPHCGHNHVLVPASPTLEVYVWRRDRQVVSPNRFLRASVQLTSAWTRKQRNRRRTDARRVFVCASIHSLTSAARESLTQVHSIAAVCYRRGYGA